MIDIHSHILPSIDDGAKSVEESIDHLSILNELGFDKFVLTPHIYKGFFDNKPADILEKFGKFSDLMNNYFKDKASFYPGAEVYLSDETIDDIIGGNTLTINDNKKYLLFEIDFTFIPANFDEMIKVLQRQYRLIWAHPERNQKIVEDPENLKKYIDLDILVQTNIGSYAGEFGTMIANTAKYLLVSDMVHLLGSDCHCGKSKAGHLVHGMQIFDKYVNPEYRELIVNGYPQKVLNGEIFYPHYHLNIKKSKIKKILKFLGFGK